MDIESFANIDIGSTAAMDAESSVVMDLVKSVASLLPSMRMEAEVSNNALCMFMSWDVDGYLEEIQVFDDDVWDKGHIQLKIFGAIDEYDGREEIEGVLNKLKSLRPSCEIVYEC